MSHDHGVAAADPAGWLLPVLAIVLLGGPYLLGAARWRRRRGHGWSRWRTSGWLAGTVLVSAALAPPLTAYAHDDARGHMVQHLVLGMYAPLALVLAAPVTLLLGGLGRGGRRRVGRVLASRPAHVLGHPVTAAVLVTGGLWLLYLTPLYAVSQQVPAVHHLVCLHFLVSGYLFAWAIAGPDPAARRPGTAPRLVVLVASAALHAVLGKLLYARAGQLPPEAGVPAFEMEAAAQIMYYGGDGAEVLLAAALLAGWYRARGRRLQPQRSPVAHV